jgi:hypothetical protein
MIRATFALTSYLGLTWLLLVMFCVWPGQTLALVSPAAYARVVAQAEWIAYQAATKPAVVEAVATAASSTSPAGWPSVPWPGRWWAALGVLAGVALYQTYYSDAKMQALVQAVAPHLGEALWTVTSGSGSPLTVAWVVECQSVSLGDGAEQREFFRQSLRVRLFVCDRAVSGQCRPGPEPSLGTHRAGGGATG